MFPDLSGVSLVLQKSEIRAYRIMIRLNLVGMMMSPSMLKARSELVEVAGKGQTAFQYLANKGKMV